MKYALNLLILLLIAVKAPAAVVDLPFGRKVDTTLLEKAVTISTPRELVKFIKAQNIEVYKVSREGESAPNFAFAFLAEAPTELRSELDEGSRARMVPTYDVDVTVKTEVILVDTSVEPYHLLHEFFHALAARSMTQAQIREEVEASKAQYGVERRYKVYWDKMYRDASYREDAHWRKDFVGYILDYADQSLKLFKYSYAEEITADWVVAHLLFEKKSPFLTKKTLEDAVAYMKSNYNSITVRVDDMYFVPNWVLNTMYGNTEDTGIEVPMSEKFTVTEQFKQLKKSYDSLRPDFDTLIKMVKDVDALVVPDTN